MHTTISKRTKTELLEALRQRYRQATKDDKSRILDEFVVVAGCHRKHAIRLLTAAATTPVLRPAVALRTYDEAVREALVVLWEAADRICGKRLKAVLPDLIMSLEQHGHLSLDPIVRQRLLSVSAATIDRLLASVRGTASGRKKRRRAKKPSQQVAVRTFADWNDLTPGYPEIDFVAHGGESMQGTFLWSLAATDVCSGWTEAVPLLAREQSLVAEGLAVLRRQFPVRVLAIDSDNDSAFINETLLGYCQRQQLQFTHSRAYHKNDQAWIEQKNGAVVRRFVGYERLSSVVAGQCLAQLYQAVRLFVNYFQPSFKLRSKTREGAKVKKTYHAPTTPCARFLAHPSASEVVKEKLRSERDCLDPLELLHRIRESQAALAAPGSGDMGSGPIRESLEQFLAKLPELWRAGEVRPTHRQAASRPRAWRTRADPFAGVWPEILLWLQEDPEATAKSLFERLDRAYPGRFPPGTTADVAAPHRGVAACHGPRTRLQMLGKRGQRPRAGRPRDRRRSKRGEHRGSDGHTSRNSAIARDAAPGGGNQRPQFPAPPVPPPSFRLSVPRRQSRDFSRCGSAYGSVTFPNEATRTGVIVVVHQGHDPNAPSVASNCLFLQSLTSRSALGFFRLVRNAG